MLTVPALGLILAPHAFRSSFGRTAKSRVWQIRHWDGVARSIPTR